MKFILEYKSFYKEGDVVLIKYWYNKMITPVKIIETRKGKYLVSHNIDGSKIQNAPDELIEKTKIIATYRF